MGNKNSFSFELSWMCQDGFFFLELKSFIHISTDVRLQSKAKALATRSGTIFVQIDPTPNSRTQAAHS
jgi:hypothetical protein